MCQCKPARLNHPSHNFEISRAWSGLSAALSRLSSPAASQTILNRWPQRTEVASWRYIYAPYHVDLNDGTCAFCVEDANVWQIEWYRLSNTNCWSWMMWASGWKREGYNCYPQPHTVQRVQRHWHCSGQRPLELWSRTDWRVSQLNRCTPWSLQLLSSVDLRQIPLIRARWWCFTITFLINLGKVPRTSLNESLARDVCKTFGYEAADMVLKLPCSSHMDPFMNAPFERMGKSVLAYQPLAWPAVRSKKMVREETWQRTRSSSIIYVWAATHMKQDAISEKWFLSSGKPHRPFILERSPMPAKRAHPRVSIERHILHQLSQALDANFSNGLQLKNLLDRQWRLCGSQTFFEARTSFELPLTDMYLNFRMSTFCMALFNGDRLAIQSSSYCHLPCLGSGPWLCCTKLPRESLHFNQKVRHRNHENCKSNVSIARTSSNRGSHATSSTNSTSWDHCIST